MKPEELDLAGNKFTFLAMVLAAIWFFSLLMKTIFLDFEGIDIYWFLASILSFAASWFLFSRIITKRLCGFIHVFLVVLGLFILLFVSGYSFFAYLLQILFFLIMLGLFTSLFIDWQNGFNRMVIIASGFYLFFAFLPISSYGRLYIKELFYWNFVNYSADMILYWIPFLIALAIILEKILMVVDKLPEKLQPDLVYKLSFFAGLLYLAYYLFRQAVIIGTFGGFSGFVGGFFTNIFVFSLCATLLMGILELTEDKLGRPLSIAVD